MLCQPRPPCPVTPELPAPRPRELSVHIFVSSAALSLLLARYSLPCRRPLPGVSEAGPSTASQRELAVFPALVGTRLALGKESALSDPRQKVANVKCFCFEGREDLDSGGWLRGPRVFHGEGATGAGHRKLRRIWRSGIPGGGDAGTGPEAGSRTVTGGRVLGCLLQGGWIGAGPRRIQRQSQGVCASLRRQRGAGRMGKAGIRGGFQAEDVTAVPGPPAAFTSHPPRVRFNVPSPESSPALNAWLDALAVDSPSTLNFAALYLMHFPLPTGLSSPLAVNSQVRGHVCLAVCEGSDEHRSELQPRLAEMLPGQTGTVYQLINIGAEGRSESSRLQGCKPSLRGV